MKGIGRGEVHVYEFHLTGEGDELIRSWERLSFEERERAERFYFAEDRQKYILAHCALREILAGYLNTAPEEIRFTINEYGKPLLPQEDGAPPYHFNLTHSGEIGLVAVALDAQVGIDVERIRSIDQIDSMARQIFVREEYEAWQSVPERALEVFFAGWVRKEAVVKGLGKGLSLALHSFRVPLLDAQVGQVLFLDAPGEAANLWWVHPLAMPGGYVAALATDGPRQIIRSGIYITCITIYNQI